MADHTEHTFDKVLSLLPKESVELVNQCSELLQNVVLTTTSTIYQDCEEHGIILDPIQQEVFINAFVRATTANAAFFLTTIDRNNQIIQQMTSGYADMVSEVEQLQLADQQKAILAKPQKKSLFKR